MPPDVEAYVCEKLGLRPAPASSQIIQRDRHAEFFAVLALVASSLEKFSVEIRHLQRTEVLEVEERFRTGQKGSSAMPHKRNPILSENVTGLSRLVRGYAIPAMENVALWHERDISHSSVERVIAPDATVTLDFALVRMKRIIDELVVYPENMMLNFKKTRGLPFSQGVLLALVRAGLSRQDAYQLVQVLAMKAWDEGLDFEVLVRADDAIMGHLDAAVIDECFNLEFALRHIPFVFQRVFG
jgi:adenylosuccinate lyase